MADANTICHQAQEALNERNIEQARELFLRAVEIKPEHPDAHYGLATACFLSGDFLGAAHHFREVTRHDPLRAGAFVNLGAIYNRLGRYEDAISTLRRGIQLSPGRGEGYYNLALVYRQLEQWDRAIDAYREAIRVNPKMSEAHFNLANLLLEVEKFSAAIVHYRHALKLRPQWPEATQGLQMAEEAAAEIQAATHAAVTAQLAPARAPRVAARINPEDEPRIDPRVHSVLLSDLHQLTKSSEHMAHQLGNDLSKQLDEALKTLSSSLIKPDTTAAEVRIMLDNFAKLIEKFQEARKKMQEAQSRFRSFEKSLKT